MFACVQVPVSNLANKFLLEPILKWSRLVKTPKKLPVGSYEVLFCMQPTWLQYVMQTERGLAMGSNREVHFLVFVGDEGSKGKLWSMYDGSATEMVFYGQLRLQSAGAHLVLLVRQGGCD